MDIDEHNARQAARKADTKYPAHDKLREDLEYLKKYCAESDNGDGITAILAGSSLLDEFDSLLSELSSRQQYDVTAELLEAAKTLRNVWFEEHHRQVVPCIKLDGEKRLKHIDKIIANAELSKTRSAAPIEECPKPRWPKTEGNGYWGGRHVFDETGICQECGLSVKALPTSPHSQQDEALLERVREIKELDKDHCHKCCEIAAKSVGLINDMELALCAPKEIDGELLALVENLQEALNSIGLSNMSLRQEARGKVTHYTNSALTLSKKIYRTIAARASSKESYGNE